MSFSAIGKILQNRSGGVAPMARQVTAALIVEKTNGILEKYFPNLIPEYLNVICFKNGFLVVGVASATAAQEVRLKKKRILSELEEGLGAKIVLDIKFAPIQPIY